MPGAVWHVSPAELLLGCTISAIRETRLYAALCVCLLSFGQTERVSYEVGGAGVLHTRAQHCSSGQDPIQSAITY